jgi:hypothetical protein
MNVKVVGGVLIGTGKETNSIAALFITNPK